MFNEEKAHLIDEMITRDTWLKSQKQKDKELTFYLEKENFKKKMKDLQNSAIYGKIAK